MSIAVEIPDVERLVVDYLDAVLTEQIGVGIPSNWTATSQPFLQVSCDGHPFNSWPVTMTATVRLVGWAKTTTTAKALAARAQGLLCAHPGGDGIAVVQPLTGPLPARDPDNAGAQLAAVTCSVTLRAQPIA